MKPRPSMFSEEVGVNGCRHCTRDYWGEYDCLANTTLDCDHCKFGAGRKNPFAKCNQIKDVAI